MRGSFFGFDFGEFAVDDERKKKHLVKLKYRYTGNYDFSNTKLEGKLSVFPLPIYYQANKADFDAWMVNHGDGKNYQKTQNSW